MNTKRADNRKMARIIPKGFPWRLIIISAALIYAVLTFIDQRNKLELANKKNEELIQQQEALENDIDHLERRKAFVNTDDYVEQNVRSRLGWVGEDDIIFYAADPSDATQQSSQGTESTPDQ